MLLSRCRWDVSRSPPGLPVYTSILEVCALSIVCPFFLIRDTQSHACSSTATVGCVCIIIITWYCYWAYTYYIGTHEWVSVHIYVTIYLYIYVYKPTRRPRPPGAIDLGQLHPQPVTRYPFYLYFLIIIIF